MLFSCLASQVTAPASTVSPDHPPGPRRQIRAQRARRLEQRIAAAARAAVAARGFVTSIDVLVGVGWLQAVQVERWAEATFPTWNGLRPPT